MFKKAGVRCHAEMELDRWERGPEAVRQAQGKRAVEWGVAVEWEWAEVRDEVAWAALPWARAEIVCARNAEKLFPTSAACRAVR